MRKLKVSCAGWLPAAALLLAAAPAFAADVDGSVPTLTWNGLYVGINGGYGAGQGSPRFDMVPPGNTDQPPKFHPHGWLAGGQLGFNWEFQNNATFGLEGSLDAAGITATTTATFSPDNINTETASETEKITSLGAFRARMGVDMGGVMPYIIGGVAFGSGQLDVTAIPPSAPPANLSGHASKTFTGWTVGAGAEVAIDNHWSVRGEYSYVDLGKQTLVVPGPGSGSDVQLTANIITAALNYRW